MRRRVVTRRRSFASQKISDGLKISEKAVGSNVFKHFLFLLFLITRKFPTTYISWKSCRKLMHLVLSFLIREILSDDSDELQVGESKAN